MILGMTIETFVALHVVVSLVGIASGFMLLSTMLGSLHQPMTAAVFLATTVLTSVTGFMIPFTVFGPAHVVGAISLVVLVATVAALYRFRLNGWWRPVYVAGAVTALYLNVFVGVVQAFQKFAPLSVLAPTQSEPPFLLGQSAVLALFVLLGIVAARRFHP